MNNQYSCTNTYDSPPKVSFVVLLYNHERYVEESIRSALSQTYSNLEIFISDDASVDDTFSIAARVVSEYNGPHKVILNRNEENIGLAASFNLAWKKTNGDFIVIQAGDDISLPQRTAVLTQLWQHECNFPDLVYSNISRIDSNGIVIGSTVDEGSQIVTFEDMIHGAWFIAGGMACAYSRQIIEKFGELNPNIVYEDFVLTFRALAGRGIAFSPMALVNYRVHDASIIGQRKLEAPNDRLSAQRWYTHLLAEYGDRLSVWRQLHRSNFLFEFKLKRQIGKLKIQLQSSGSTSKLKLLKYMFFSLITFRFKTAKIIFFRDMLSIR